jgi:glycosyltransferase involved in cell wall biosynthesis
VVVVVVTPIQAPAYLGILAGLGRGPVARARRLTAGRRGGAAAPAPASPRSASGPAVLALCHNVLPHERRAADEPLIRAVLRQADAVLVHTDAEAARAAGLTGVPVHVAAMAPHLWSAPTRRGGGEARDPARPVGASPHRRLLFFGLVRPYKGLDVLLRALAAGPGDVALTVAGEFWGGTGPTEALITELGIADRVELRPGYVDAAEVPALFAASDALVLPYRAGTASQNVDLAHLHGLPVVATSVGTLATAVADGVDGLLVAPDDPAALAAALFRLYEPGVLPALAAKVRPPDVAAGWDRYLDVLTAAVSGA